MAGGSLTAPQRQMAAELGVDTAIFETGPLTRADLANCYRSAQLLFVPSEREGFGLPVVYAEKPFLGFQLDRESPFSVWGWGQYHAAGVPDLKLVQRVLQALLVAAAVAVAFVPRRKSPLQLAALTGALIAGVELVLEHWSYLYIPWFFAFAAFAFLAGAPRTAPPPVPEEEQEEPRALVAAG